MLTDIITAYRRSVALYTFVKLKIPLWLGREGSMSLDVLAAAVGVDSNRLSRLLDVMIDYNIVYREDMHYILAEQAKCLADENSLETLWILCELGEEYWRMWPDYPLSLQSAVPVPAFEVFHGQPFFSYLLSRPHLKNIFDNLMTKITEQLSAQIIDYIECEDQLEVVDVGGGCGVLLKTILQKYKLKAAVVFDRYCETSRMEAGIDYMAGDFFVEVVAGKDLYILKNILHDWDDQLALKILKNCHEAMKLESKLIVVEIIKEHGMSKGNTLDLLMDALFLGKERFEHEYEALAKLSGFTIEKIIPTTMSQSVMIWRKDIL